MDGVWRDLRSAARNLSRSPGFTAVASLTLAIGLAANAVIFSLSLALLSSNGNFKDPDRIIGVSATGEWGGLLEFESIPFPDFQDLRTDANALRNLVAFKRYPTTLGPTENGNVALGEAISGEFFGLFNVVPLAGRFIETTDDHFGAAPVVVLSYAGWQRRFGADPAIIGRTVPVGGHPFTVVGIAPKGFSGVFRGVMPEFWVTIPAVIENSPKDRAALADRSNPQVWAVTLLDAPSDSAAAATQLHAVSDRLAKSYPTTNAKREFVILPGADIPAHPAIGRRAMKAAAIALFTQTGLILLIAASNVSGLIMARAFGRRRDLAVRSSLGARRVDILRLIIAENFLIAAASAILAVVAAEFLLSAFNTLRLPIPVELGFNLGIDVRVIAFTSGLALLTGVIAGVLPAARATATDVFSVLKEGSSTVPGGKRQAIVRRAIISTEVAVSMVLLVLALMTFRSFANAAMTKPGFQSDFVSVVSVDPAIAGYDQTRGQQFLERSLRDLSQIPGVETVTTVQPVPLTLNIRITRIRTAQHKGEPASALPLMDTAIVGPSFFQSLQIPVLSGRDFSVDDSATRPRVAIVNRSLAQQLWPNELVIGKRFEVGFPEPFEVQIVGVVADIKSRTLGDSNRPIVYTAALQDPAGWQGLNFLIRTRRSIGELNGAVKTVIENIDAGLPVQDAQTLNDRIGIAFTLPRYAFAIFGATATVGLILAAIGLYGVVAYTVGQRTRELAVRVALGSTRSQLLRMVIGDATRVTVWGIAVGVPLAVFIASGIAAILYGVSPYDPISILLALAVTTVVSVGAAYGPAVRASRVDPLVALRDA